jgi:hypothetical protein
MGKYKKKRLKEIEGLSSFEEGLKELGMTEDNYNELTRKERRGVDNWLIKRGYAICQLKKVV